MTNLQQTMMQKLQQAIFGVVEKPNMIGGYLGGGYLPTRPLAHFDMFDGGVS